MLVVHDTGDTINRFADGQAYQQAIAGARLFRPAAWGTGKS